MQSPSPVKVWGLTFWGGAGGGKKLLSFHGRSQERVIKVKNTISNSNKNAFVAPAGPPRVQQVGVILGRKDPFLPLRSPASFSSLSEREEKDAGERSGRKWEEHQVVGFLVDLHTRNLIDFDNTNYSTEAINTHQHSDDTERNEQDGYTARLACGISPAIL